MLFEVEVHGSSIGSCEGARQVFAHQTVSCSRHPERIRIRNPHTSVQSTCMVKPLDPPQPAKVTGQCTFKRLLSKRLVCASPAAPPPRRSVSMVLLQLTAR